MLHPMPARKHTAEQWQIARDAVALGASTAAAAAAAGMSQRRLLDKMKAERWPRPSQLPTLPRPNDPPAIQAASLTLSQRGEAHRSRVADLVERALRECIPPALTNWSDIERAAKLGDQAFGLHQAAPLVSLTFPAAQSTESHHILDISANTAPIVEAATLPPDRHPLPPAEQ
jgi:hypothetical protein